MMRRPLQIQVEAEIGRATGRRYQINLDALDDRSLLEFIRLLRDLDYDKMVHARRAARQPWRHG